MGNVRVKIRRKKKKKDSDGPISLKIPIYHPCVMRTKHDPLCFPLPGEVEVYFNDTHSQALVELIVAERAAFTVHSLSAQKAPTSVPHGRYGLAELEPELLCCDVDDVDELEMEGLMVADDVMPGAKSGNPAGNDRGKVAESESREVESGGAMLLE